MRLLLRHDHPGQQVFVDWADLSGETSSTLQPLTPTEWGTYDVAGAMYASSDRQAAAEAGID